MGYMSGHRTHGGRRKTAPVSLDGKKYKSGGEAAIANWLLYNGIPFDYEPKYDGWTKGARYRPDFRIHGTDVYIEYFGTDEHGNVPPYFQWSKEEYNDSIRWKRDIHRANGTVMIELYAYEYSDGTLFDRLENNLKANGIDFSTPVSSRVSSLRRSSERRRH